MAGCDNSKEILKITYDDTTQTVKSQHGDWSPTQVRLEVAHIFRPQYRQNEESVKTELSGKEEYEGTEFTFDYSRGVRFVNGDGTVGLLELHERQLRLTPNLYSEDEHKVSLLIDQTFRAGANEVVTSYPRPDGQRDIVVMTLDKATGKGTMRIINTQVDHTGDEIKSISKIAFNHLSESSVGRAYILSDAPVPQEKAQQAFSNLDTAIHSIPREATRAVNNTVKEITYPAASEGAFFQRRKEKVIDTSNHISLTDRIKQVFGYPSIPLKDTVPKKFEKSGVLRRITGIAERNFSKARNSMKLIPLPDHAIPLAFFVSTRKVAERNVTPEIKKSIARHERKMNKKRMNSEIKQSVRPQREILLKEKLPKQRLWQKIERHSKKKKENILSFRLRRRRERRVMFAEGKELKKRNIRKEVTQRKPKELLKKETVVRLLIIAKKFIRRKERMIIARLKKPEPTGVQRVEKKRQSREHDLDFSIALVFWLLVKPSRATLLMGERYHVPLHDSKIVTRNSARVSQEKSKLQERLLHKEPAQWILLAIIWYLSMIREQGQIQSSAVGYQLSAKKKLVMQRASWIPMPVHGVIFAYAS